MAPRSVHLDQFAFQVPLTFTRDAAWPARIWEALARASGVKGELQEQFFGATPKTPKKLDGTFMVGANVLATRAAQAWNPQVVSLSFAAFDDSGKLVAWSRDHDDAASDGGWFGGFAVVDGNATSRGITLRAPFLRKLLLEGKKRRKAAAKASARPQR